MILQVGPKSTNWFQVSLSLEMIFEKWVITHIYLENSPTEHTGEAPQPELPQELAVEVTLKNWSSEHMSSDNTLAV